jgi:hemoglobin/transferrin/lactoferrin receptor protein
MRGAQALLFGTSFVALTVGNGSAAFAQSTQTLDPITVLATKTEEKAIESLAGVSTLRQEQLEIIQATRPSELTWGMPSVWFQDRGDNPESSINIRGLQDFGRVAVIIDGARQNFQRSGHNANGTFFLEPELLAGVDVIRGPVANVYGSGAIGGVASFRTKDVDDILKPGQRWGAEVFGLGGSNVSRGLGSAFAGARGPYADIFAGGTYRSQSNYQDGNGAEVPNSGADVATGIGKLTVRPAPGHQVKLSGITYDARFDTGQQFPNQESVYDTRVRNNIVNARWRYSRPEDRLFDFDGNVYWTNTEQKQTKIANGTPGSMGNPITGFVGDSRSFGIDTKGFDVYNTSRFDTGAVRHALTYGGDYFRDDVQNNDPTGNGEVLTPNGQRTVSGAFAQWRVNYSTWLEAIGALRYDRYELTSPAASSDGDHLSPKLTVGITPVNGFTVYGTFAEGYRAPAVTETLVVGPHPPFAVGFPNLFTLLPNPLLQPEVGKTLEAGINLRYDNILTKGDKLRAKFNVFRNDIDNYIELVNFGPPVLACPPGVPLFVCQLGFVPFITVNSTSLAQYQNIGEARIEGVEFEGTYDTGDWFVNLAGSHLRGRDVTAGIPLATIPPDKLSAMLGLRLYDRKLTLAARLLAVAAKKASDIPDRDGNGLPDYLPVGGYTIVNLYVGYAPTPDVIASFSVDNVFNAYYVPYLNAGGPSEPGQPPPIIFPGPGVTYKAAVRIRFGSS